MTTQPKAVNKKKKINWGQMMERDWQLWIMLLPGIVYIFIFCYIPMY